MNKKTLYEVYDRRALVQDPFSLPLLDRDTMKKKALKSARKWGGVVLQINAEIVRQYPLERRVISYKLIYVYKGRRRKSDARDKITRKMLSGKLRDYTVRLRR